MKYTLSKKAWILKMPILFCILGMLFMTSAVIAQNSPTYDPESDYLSFEDWDDDNNKFIDQTEFKGTFTSEFHTDLGSEDDPSLDDEDFYQFIYAYLDTNDNNLLSEQEWKTADELFFADFLFKDFETYDTDEDDNLSYEEYINTIYDTKGFEKWDINRDGFVDQNELADAVFNSWDIDNDGALNYAEYSRFERYFKDLN